MSASAQPVGLAFFPDSTYYRETTTYITGSSGGTATVNYAYINKYVLGDTVMNNNYYQRIHYTSLPNFDTVCLGQQHLVHYENRRVTFDDTVLVYDFNLGVGDSILRYFGCYSCPYPPGQYYFKVSQVDSVFIGNWWRKRITLYKPLGSFSTRWVEGIGDIDYGFNVNYFAIKVLQSAMGGHHLDCFREHFQYTYGSACPAIGATCNMVGVKEELLRKEDIDLNPQPASDVLYIKSTPLYFNKQKPPVLYDLRGERIGLLFDLINGNTYRADVSELEAGVYFVLFESAEGLVKKKLLVQH
jgi:hypothetical protein